MRHADSFLYTRKIVIVGAGKSCGASFVAGFLADGLKKLGSVSLTEMGSAYFYDALSMEKHFLSRGFSDYFAKIRANERIDDKNAYDDIIWNLRLPSDDKSLSAAECFRAFNNPKEEYCLFDCSGLDQELALNLLAEADKAILVIDPLPSSLLASRQFIEKVRISLPKTILLVNKMNSGVHISELNRFLATKDYFSLASVPSEYIYKAEYAGVSLMRLKELSYMKKTQDILVELLQ